MKIKVLALSLIAAFASSSALAFVALPESGQLRITAQNDVTEDPLWLGFGWSPTSEGYTRAAARVSSVLYDGIDVGNFYDYVFRSDSDNTLLFASRFELLVGEVEVGDLEYEVEINDIFRRGFAGYDVSVGWYFQTGSDFGVSSVAHSNSPRTRPANLADVFDDNVVDFRTDISVEEGNPTTAWYVIKTNATQFDYLANAVSIRQAPSVSGDDPPLRNAMFEGFAPIPAVPEPSEYAMFLAGLGMVGFVARRRMNRI
ncbi:MAG: PEP-CTERM sorting domain-containing protein [Methyloversatilis discipulorum]|uniref:PEP-CTERM sorting domain-containing protein n=1 Tax=Methyloversatilis discipulorum TaxID=1119528 RepID=UPI0026F23BFE|nr:PEP-CTERM sorting domain-containing protein [Methyloversatilis discipulorum]MBT9516479.1 PEP-CTERM sorting domain-containing protein [Methyloversatilis discipulorum]